MQESDENVSFSINPSIITRRLPLMLKKSQPKKKKKKTKKKKKKEGRKEANAKHEALI
jgi:hypothetical protein